MGDLIYIVDDEPDILEAVSVNLQKTGFQAKGFLDAKSFYRKIGEKVPDLIILDLMLPDEDGLEICKKLRDNDLYSEIPIIILSARGEESDRIVGLELGADDYITKPFSPRELVARVRAILRRRTRGEEEKRIEIGDILAIDLQKYETFVSGKKVELTTTEFNILKLLASKKGMVFSREKILDYLWGDEKTVIDRTVDMHIKNLRKKLKEAAPFIKSLRGIGYKIET
jgi:two-component system phosphate regulon response regulator PhoB/two-component system alkaline phosphatase synthesis response regulator PhoP